MANRKKTRAAPPEAFRRLAAPLLARGVICQVDVDEFARRIAGAKNDEERGRIAMEYLAFASDRLELSTARTIRRHAARNPQPN